MADMADRERRWLNARMWIGPGALSLILFGELLYMLISGPVTAQPVHYISPAAVGVALYTRYLLAVEIGSMLLLAGLIGAYHFGRRHGGERPGNP
ncbi:MAG TPA: NADH-quinone oxidoreductase subunit J, partial [Gammaproteobacteria bacterium]|nr:NADH-quinone oxidoreductase subunit J [Gammaproteobacteria bacterium]